MRFSNRSRRLSWLVIQVLVGAVVAAAIVMDELQDGGGAEPFRIVAIILAVGAALQLVFQAFASVANIGKRDGASIFEFREQLIANQRRQWIDRILHPSLGKKREIINVPFTSDEKFAAKLKQRLQSDKDSTVPQVRPRIVDAFNEAGQQLIILGEGGAGKTIALLELLEDLLEELDDAPTDAIPVVFDLGSWATTQQPLTEWFVTELENTFESIPENRDIERLVAQRNLIFLIDSFDELPIVQQQPLFDELQKFANDETRYALCSRPEAYQSIEHSHKSHIQTIRLGKVSTAEVLDYLSGDDHRQIRELILESENKALFEAVRRPFILNALAYAYANPTSGAIRTLQTALRKGEDMVGDDGLDPVPREILRRYVNQQLGRAVDDNDDIDSDYYYAVDEVNDYLTWIAHELNQQQQSAANTKKEVRFFLDFLQPSWLADSRWRWIYTLLSRTLGATAIVMSVGFFMASPFDYILSGLVAGLALGSVDGVLRYTSFGAITQRFKRIPPFLMRTGILYLACSFTLSIWFGLTVSSPSADRILNESVSLTGITLGWFVSLFIAAIYSTRHIRLQFKQDDITSIDLLQLEFRTFTRFFLRGGVSAGLVVGVFAQGLGVHQTGTTMLWVEGVINHFNSPLINPFTIGFPIGFFFGGIVVGTFGFLAVTERSEQWLRPNQGINTSIWNAARISASLAIIFGALFGLIQWAQHDDIDGFFRGCRNGIAIGLLGGLWYGGIDTIHHAALRFILYVSGRTPLRLRHFLAYATNYNLMREIGAFHKYAHQYLGYYYRTSPSPVFSWRSSAVLLALGLIITTVVAAMSRPLVHRAMFPFRNETYTYEIGGSENPDAVFTGAEEPFCADSTDSTHVTVKSRGIVRSGDFMGYVTPEGSEVGLFGLAIGDGFDLVPHLPNNALLCKFDSEPDDAWRPCARVPAGFTPHWTTRAYELDMPATGCMEFAINEVEIEKRSGYFYMSIVPVE